MQEDQRVCVPAPFEPHVHRTDVDVLPHLGHLPGSAAPTVAPPGPGSQGRKSPRVTRTDDQGSRQNGTESLGPTGVAVRPRGS